MDFFDDLYDEDNKEPSFSLYEFKKWLSKQSKPNFNKISESIEEDKKEDLKEKFKKKIKDKIKNRKKK